MPAARYKAWLRTSNGKSVGTHWYTSWQLTVKKMARVIHLVVAPIVSEFF